MDETGREKLAENNFGASWEKFEGPVIGIVGTIDDSGEDASELRLGLSAMQLRNLNLKRLGNAGNIDTLLRAVMRNREGLTDDQEYPMVIVRSGENQAYAHVYNAFGELSTELGPEVRISKKLAEELKLEKGFEITIEKPKDAFQLENTT